MRETGDAAFSIGIGWSLVREMAGATIAQVWLRARSVPRFRFLSCIAVSQLDMTRFLPCLDYSES